jgi:hypothetical protein
MKQLGLTYAAGTAIDSKTEKVSVEGLNKCRTMLTMLATPIQLGHENVRCLRGRICIN